MAKGTSSRGKPSANMEGFPRKTLGFGLHLQNLTAFVHAGLQVDVVRTAQFTGILVLDIGRALERVGRTAHAAARRRGFSFRHSHGKRAPEIRDVGMKAAL